ncbi:zinc finger and BTB domain-containing protein 44-like isoform X1 [Ischnura elegans]|uniref:zinc finger and BTB domain-containing protein 44-like isoform X1 n=1 Tax=Ischnura elegans TaxID=197161 RepID=UPI001ED89DDD|nr:zinc finger and BTB domain-containing protein 44-like isoform X1 [Ischnura elegans]XP_046393246.1 zinc finger and BTB domain-containing protein 44-like isoform X1 [Ischnura elegans]XP_046393247.1 zinc finger and BTB domain-containing protein 44-like isoform X1 [Ischnura elegans]XP_046393248.1 zinc finger and BTB domain-containing protein 44-like isoform X1 [Ischnura elegans]
MIEDNAASRPAMSSSQRFCLRWNNHQSNLLSVFDQLLHDESFVDVTLAVEGLFLKAHKMVLSACSPYFQTLFVHNPDKHPIVILKDVPYADMRSLLDFMYRGEVSVDQDRLTAFLRVAESLRIKGLTEVNEERCDLPTITSSLLSSAAAAAASASSSAATATPPPLQPQPTPPSQPSAVATPPIMPTAPAPSASPIALTSTPPPAPPPAHPPPPASSSSPMLERPTRPPPPAIPMPPKRSAPSPVHGAPPKRKRGRPRKLSGSDQTTTKRPQVTPKAEPSTTGSSESTPGASPAREKLGTSSPSADRSDVKSSEGRITRESKTRDGGGSKDTLLLSSALALDSRVKDDPEPTPGTSTQDVAQGYGSPAVTPDAEAYASETEYQPASAFESYQLQVQPSSEERVHRHPQKGEIPAGIHFLSHGHQVDLGFETCILPERPSILHFAADRGLLVPKIEEVEVEQGEDEEVVGVEFGEVDDEEGEDGALFYDENGVIQRHGQEPSIPLSPTPNARQELWEYVLRGDGSVVCKWCGEVLPSRTHWYRHKYKVHAVNLFRCNRCNVFFKTKKGFAGHLENRHGGNSVGEISASVIVEGEAQDGEEGEAGAGSSIRKSKSTSLGASSSGSRKDGRGKGRDVSSTQSADWAEQRQREEKLVAEIIDRVRRECEAQGATVSRRGYSRRSTVMNSS